MNRIQIGVIATAIFLAVLIFGLTRQSYDKHDLLGVIPGMTHKQAESAGKARKWGCEDRPAAREFVCATGRGTLTMEYLAGGDQKVARATLRLSDTTGSAQALADDISEQYRKKPVSVEGQEPAITFTWKLDEGLTLQMRKSADAADISIVGDDLQKQRDNEKPDHAN
ncbi:hypothetical protein AFIC_001486 [[Pseudomonas] carboxydohydrogena]|uniref:Uncharacterized protein n=1 Tax=Afipia carboxydohydrogena TaxID=290 RepID=A0ABY8BSL2_AFICR|nr:hypothetical protein [[Pseudomonas] carboxydohydrogena]WEF52972.1 hypothetical protein AFIC_001486 [[Pseudomonas] carboxydohydrogena]